MEGIRGRGTDYASPSRQVKSFYDAFRDERLVRDFRKVNLRQQAAIQLVRSIIPKNARALEIGCGVGIITRALISRVSFILAIDISEANIQLAQRVLRTAKAEFGIFDVVNDDPRWVADRGPFDAVLLIDTIEHITSGEHEALFARIERWLKPGGYVILTYPSPDYQTFLHNEQPTKLQIIDEVVRLGELLSKTILVPVHYSLKDMWLKEQYAHLILQKHSPHELTRVNRGILWRVMKRCRDFAWRGRNARILLDLQQNGIARPPPNEQVGA